MTEPSVLAVEDDANLRRLLETGLGEAGFRVRTARNGEEAMRLAAAAKPDLLVVDIGLPDTDGRDLCRALKANGVAAPVLFLTALDSGADRVSGFTAGGDDYLTKPFLFAELVARLRALARRTGPGPVRERSGDLELDPVTHRLACGDRKVELTPTEFRLMAALIAGGETVTRREELRGAGWPTGAVVHDNTVDVYVGRLRRKLVDLDSDTGIGTVHGVGYRLR